MTPANIDWQQAARDAMRDHLNSLFTELLTQQQIAEYFAVGKNKVPAILAALERLGHVQRLADDSRVRIRVETMPPRYHEKHGWILEN